RPCRRARGLPRERVLGNAGGTQERRRDLDPRRARGKDARLKTMRIVEWTMLDTVARSQVLARPAVQVGDSIGSRVREIVDRVRAEGDAALISLAAELDGA